MPDNKVKKQKENYAELEEEQSGIVQMLITFTAMIAVAALICTVVWKVTHKGPRADFGKAVVEVDNEISGSLADETDANPTAAEAEIEKDPINGDANMVFEAVDEDVTAKDAAIIRILPDTEGITSVAGQLRNGQFLKRIGINKDTGWSKVLYNGQEGYIISYYLTTDKDYKAEEPANPDNRVTTMDGYVILFRDCNDIVTVATQEYVNLRTEPSTSQGKTTISAQLKSGLTARRTGVSIDSGWSRVEFNGLELYVVTKYIKEVSGATVPDDDDEETDAQEE
ncbi:MAG: hypothetical protein II139_02855 [Lachnospiraceae bacterium]|jgi:uncharacterized protein YgiM (DUF1202 family)|nr:hypothetical protein [Lachnospiraceae bacterium]